uniref:Uncharacterized protein n=1 Tax=Vitis vinifera TaxID=29760 RepID=F6HGE6_VITVI
MMSSVYGNPKLMGHSLSPRTHLNDTENSL